ncbi:MAG: hypothetical protein E7569_02735 [Ruminococcaceae bacterium]|nr:hypothetical protein [Oscillospiraceae bacterium]
MKLTYNFTECDYIEFALRSAKKNNKRILTIAALLLTGLFIMILAASHASVKVIIEFAFILIAVIFLNYKLHNIIVKEQAKANIMKLGKDFFTNDKTLYLSDEEIIFSTSVTVKRISIKDIMQIHTDDKFAYIDITDSAIFIPLSTSKLPVFLSALKDKWNKEQQEQEDH